MNWLRKVVGLQRTHEEDALPPLPGDSDFSQEDYEQFQLGYALGCPLASEDETKKPRIIPATDNPQFQRGLAEGKKLCERLSPEVRGKQIL